MNCTMVFKKKKFIQFIYKEKFRDITKLKLGFSLLLFIVKIMHKKETSFKTLALRKAET